MSVDPELLEILVCPETQQPVRVAGAEILSALNEKIASGGVRTRGGQSVSQALTEALVREDGRILYPIEDGIPVMLVDESIEI